MLVSLFFIICTNRTQAHSLSLGVCACVRAYVYICPINASHSESDFPDILRDFIHNQPMNKVIGIHGRVIAARSHYVLVKICAIHIESDAN